MADPRATFAVIEDGSNVGQVLKQAIDTVTAASGANGSIGFAFKDSSGNVVLPQLSPSGKIIVDTESAGGTLLKSRVENSAGSLTAVTLSSITLTASKVYADITALVSSRRGALFQVIQSDNGVETVLADMIVDSGQYTFSVNLDEVQFTAGATGAQLLLIKGYNFDKISALRSTLSVVEIIA
jgi:hypothetical protein